MSALIVDLISFRPNPETPKLWCTSPARVCMIGDLVEIVMAGQPSGPYGIPTQIGSCIWREANLTSARPDLTVALKLLSQLRLK